jgi:hypothetical protein
MRALLVLAGLLLPGVAIAAPLPAPPQTRVSLSAAAAGANGDITGLSALVGTLVSPGLAIGATGITDAGPLSAAGILDTTLYLPNNVYATPNGSNGFLQPRALVAADLPSLSTLYCSLSGCTYGTAPTVPTGTQGTSNLAIANQTYVNTGLATKAPLASPAFTGYVAFSGASGLTAAGTTLGTALALTKQENFVTTVASGTGVALPNAANYQPIRIVNRGANTLNIWPFSATDQIEATTAGTAATLASAATAVFERDATNHWDRLQ